jgi:hypothetical protein
MKRGNLPSRSVFDQPLDVGHFARVHQRMDDLPVGGIPPDEKNFRAAHILNYKRLHNGYRMRLWLTLLFLFGSSRAFAADVVFSGSLERVGHESISVRLDDRRVIDARLPKNASLFSAAKIAAHYNMGDQVQFTGKPIPQVWEEETSRYQFLELTKLLFLRPPSPAELSAILEIPTAREEVNLLTRPKAPPNIGPADAPESSDSATQRELEHAREVNLQYAANMPNFVADETAKRYTSDNKSPQWRYLDTVEAEITFIGPRATRQQIRRNGKPWGRPFQALPGFKWSGFGAEIRPMFDLECPTTIEYEGRQEVRGKPLLEYRFTSPPDGCFGPFYVEYQRYNPARTGHVLIEDPSGAVVQMDEEASEFPAQFEFAKRNEEISWDYVKIGNASHLLPVRANFVAVFSSGKRWRVEVEYKNHRHFEASTNITFQEPTVKK